MAVVKALKASAGTAGAAGVGLSSDAVVATIGAEVVNTGRPVVVVVTVAAAVVGAAAAADDPGPDMADTRLLELRDLRE